MIKVSRFAYAPWGTYGILTLGDFVCYTVERPWLDNALRVSCIPEGEYALELGRYNRGDYPAYEILDVPGRTHIKVHKGNAPSEFAGCIGLGESPGFYKKQWALMNSGKVYDQFMLKARELQVSSIVITNQTAEQGVL